MFDYIMLKNLTGVMKGYVYIEWGRGGGGGGRAGIPPPLPPA